MSTSLLKLVDNLPEIYKKEYRYELDPVHFLSAPGLVWQDCLKKTGVKSKLLTDVDMLLMERL